MSAHSTAPRTLRRSLAPMVASADALAAQDMPELEPEPELAVADIQGNIWPGFNTAHMSLLGLRIDETRVDRARLWLRDIAPLVSTIESVWHAKEVRRAVAMATGAAPPRPDIFLNVALAFDALVLLGLPSANIPEGLFRSGMGKANLQDQSDANGVPIGWLTGATPETTPHVFLIVAADDAQALADAVAILAQSCGAGSGLNVIYRDQGTRLPHDREHFGFRDGISQPGMRGRRSAHPESFLTRRLLDPADPWAARFAKPGEELLWPGQFILGYPGQDEFSEAPGPVSEPAEPWMKNGSFMVFRRLRQDVAKFKAFTRQQARTVSKQLARRVNAKEIAAWMVGRWPAGQALVRCPLAPCAGRELEAGINHFDYADAVPSTQVQTTQGVAPVAGAPGDVEGLRCPHFAHVRKVNLRDKPTDIRPSQFFRLLRRGIPYGPAWSKKETVAPDRGLLFVSYQQNIEQFITLSTLWMNQTSSPEGAHGHDLLVGQNASGARTAQRTFSDGSSAQLKADVEQNWVIATGGGFFFTPARSVLAGLKLTSEN
jgi:Dyp-type peroxidase family